MKTAVIYARVSTDKQEEQRTIESQRAELRDLCARNGVKVTDEYIDDGVSGATLIRPGLDRLRDDAARGLFQVVYILSPDRLARKYVYQALVLEELRKRDIEVMFLNKPVTDRPEDQLSLGIQGLVSEYERAQIIERTRRGRIHRSKNGEMMGGSAPYGYRYVRKTRTTPAHWEVDDEEAEVVRLIFSLYSRLKSIGSVVRVLAQKGVKTRQGAKYWHRATVHKVLVGEHYVGRAYYNKRQEMGSVRKKRDRSEWIPIEVPKIMDDRTFDVTHKILKSHKGGKRCRVYVLSGIVRCKYCGCKYIGTSVNRQRQSYYRCSNQGTRFPLPRNCNARVVGAKRIEDRIMASVKDAILRPEVITNHILQRVNTARQKGMGAEKELRKLESKRRGLEARESRLLELYLEGDLPKTEYLELREGIESKRQQMDKRVNELRREVPEIDEVSVSASVRRFCEMAKVKLKNLSPERAQDLLRFLEVDATFDYKTETVRLTAHVPPMAGSNALPHVAGDTTGATRSKALKFELEVQV